MHSVNRLNLSTYKDQIMFLSYTAAFLRFTKLDIEYYSLRFVKDAIKAKTCVMSPFLKPKLKLSKQELSFYVRQLFHSFEGAKTNLLNRYAFF